ncbi:MAG: nucleotide exchange factor GrpE [Planctomycetaceae bacterium]|nr:nucleotide exchange factor GrpE [Planctomycetaceae bacterium]
MTENDGTNPNSDSDPVVSTDAPEMASTANIEEQLRGEIQQLTERWLRTEAEMENLRRRTRRELEDNAKFANQRLMVDLMEVVDNLHRALGAADQASGASLVTGVKMVAHQFEDVLKRHGCQRISTVGEVFDPNFHEAVQMVPCDSPAGSVVQEVRSGYRLHDRLIRPAQVIVAAG